MIGFLGFILFFSSLPHPHLRLKNPSLPPDPPPPRPAGSAAAFASTLGFAFAFGFTFAWPGDGMSYCWWFRNPLANHRLDGAKNPVNIWDFNGFQLPTSTRWLQPPDFWLPSTGRNISTLGGFFSTPQGLAGAFSFGFGFAFGHFWFHQFFRLHWKCWSFSWNHPPNMPIPIGWDWNIRLGIYHWNEPFMYS